MHAPVVIGVDVGKTALEAALSERGKTRTFANAPTGHAQLVRWVAQHHGSLVVLEATGRYHLAIWEALANQGIAVAVSNPRLIHHWIKSQGQRAKTDGLDAQYLARFGAQCQPAPTPLPTKAQRTIAALVGRRQQLVRDRVRLQHQQEDADAVVVDDIADQLADVANRIAVIEQRLAEQVAADPAATERVRQLRTAPGVATLTATRLTVELPELGQLTGKQIAALVGVAPLDRQSGRWRGVATIGGGRASLRHALYEPILTTIRWDPTFAAFYKRLRAKGKSVKQARIACMRRFLGVLNAMVRDGLTWQQTKVGQGVFGPDPT